MNHTDINRRHLELQKTFPTPPRTPLKSFMEKLDLLNNNVFAGIVGAIVGVSAPYGFIKGLDTIYAYIPNNTVIEEVDPCTREVINSIREKSLNCTIHV